MMMRMSDEDQRVKQRIRFVIHCKSVFFFFFFFPSPSSLSLLVYHCVLVLLGEWGGWKLETCSCLGDAWGAKVIYKGMLSLHTFLNILIMHLRKLRFKRHYLLFGLKKRPQRRSANGSTDLPETRRSWHWISVYVVGADETTTSF